MSLSNAIHMIQLLSLRNVVSVNELSEYLELTPRSIQRLKSQLVDAGFDIQTIMGPEGGYILKTRSNFFNLDLDFEELKLVRQGLQYLVQTDMVNPSPEFPLAISKLANQIDGYGIETISNFQTIRLNVNPEVYQAHISQLESAINLKQRVKIAYQKNHKVLNEYLFEPYEMVIVNKFWYIMGFDERNRYLSLKINRIQKITPSNDTFLKDESMSESSINKYGYRIKPVYLECIVTQGDFISEYIWGKHQSIEWFDDGSFKLCVEFQNEHAAKDFILKHGSKIQVLQPTEMIEWLKEELEKILTLYP